MSGHVGSKKKKAFNKTTEKAQKCTLTPYLHGLNMQIRNAHLIYMTPPLSWRDRVLHGLHLKTYFTLSLSFFLIVCKV